MASDIRTNKESERGAEIMYGKELILDIHECRYLPMNRTQLTDLCQDLCKEIDMVAEDIYFWDYQDDPEGYENAEPHLKGTSVVQFLRTSNITIHTLDELNRVYINVFSCKDFDHSYAKTWIEAAFGGKSKNDVVVTRL